MNSLSILSSRVDKVIGTTTPPPATPRTDSFKSLRHERSPNTLKSFEDRSYLLSTGTGQGIYYGNDEDVDGEEGPGDGNDGREHGALLLEKQQSGSVGDRICMVMFGPWLRALRWFISSLATSAGWLLSCLYDEDGSFSPLRPVRRFAQLLLGPFGGLQHQTADYSTFSKTNCHSTSLVSSSISPEVSHQYADDLGMDLSSSLHHSRSRSFSHEISPFSADEISPRRLIRIRLLNEEPTAKPKPTSVKSPTSPSSSLRLTKYPRSSGPPKPLLPSHPSPKTLILDLDETLIHSLSKGGRMTSGHMVEVKLDKQHAILYYVHKRPYCDDFLRKVCKWYNLVVFTASVQEYADPVIDWLEQDRKYFKGRYYRQHCTQRGSAYIKDISAVEPDLSKVMIIDNSPMSYIFHEDNAIPIEGWINDPTDIDLLHLIPLLQALQYVTDVRALLALRMGQIN